MLTGFLKIGTFEELFGSFDGQTPGRMSHREFQLWKAFNRIYPIGLRVFEFIAGVIVSAIKADGSFPWEHFPGHFWMERDKVERVTERFQEIRQKAREKAERERQRQANKPKAKR